MSDFGTFAHMIGAVSCYCNSFNVILLLVAMRTKVWVIFVYMPSLGIFFCAQEAEIRAKNMEEEMLRLQKSLEDRNEQLQASASTSEKVLFFPFQLYVHS